MRCPAGFNQSRRSRNKKSDRSGGFERVIGFFISA
jgi:hypothetical protein